VVGWAGLISMPMHQRGAGVSATDVLHIADAAAIVLLILLSIGFGAAALGKGFRIYSIATIVILLVFGALTAQQGPRIAANLPTPWIGIEERVNVYVSMLWIVVLAIALLRAQPGTGANRPKVTKG